MVAGLGQTVRSYLANGSFEHSRGGLAQSVECVVSNDEAPGSKPGFSTFASRCWALWQKCTPRGTRTRNPRIRSPMRYPLRQWGMLVVKSTFGGARTRDHRIKSPALYHLSYEGLSRY